MCLLGVSVHELNALLEHAYSHDCQNDPFSRGAYSYGKAGAGDAQPALARPVANTLFFAGEGTVIAATMEPYMALSLAEGERRPRLPRLLPTGRSMVGQPGQEFPSPIG